MRWMPIHILHFSFQLLSKLEINWTWRSWRLVDVNVDVEIKYKCFNLMFRIRTLKWRMWQKLDLCTFLWSKICFKINYYWRRGDSSRLLEIVVVTEIHYHSNCNILNYLRYRFGNYVSLSQSELQLKLQCNKINLCRLSEFNMEKMGYSLKCSN